MALNIEGASIGFNENQMITTLNNVHHNCVELTKGALRMSLGTLRDSVNECWVGQSADNFMSNQESDVEKICAGLDAAYEGLVNQFKEVGAGLNEIDQTLVERR